MAEKDKTSSTQPKSMPKDGQVIVSMMKEMGITSYEPKAVVQLNEFVYRYATSILEEARMYANNSKKKFLDIEDVRLALQLTSESTFTAPPPREVVLECAGVKNYTPLPLVKPHCGLRLPPDRYCLSNPNYTLKTSVKKTVKTNFVGSGTVSNVKLSGKNSVSYIKRNPLIKQTVTVPKPLTKITTNTNMQQKTTLKPKIQISHITSAASPNGEIPSMEVENALKRKREDDENI